MNARSNQENEREITAPLTEKHLSPEMIEMMREVLGVTPALAATGLPPQARQMVKVVLGFIRDLASAESFSLLSRGRAIRMIEVEAQTYLRLLREENRERISNE